MPTSFAQILRQHVRERPDAAALTFADHTWSFARLHEGSSRVAQALLAEGVQPGERVAMLSKNCAQSFELIYACNKMGAVLVGLNWRLSAREIAAIVADAAPRVLVVAAEEAPLLAELAPALRASLRIVQPVRGTIGDPRSGVGERKRRYRVARLLSDRLSQSS